LNPYLVNKYQFYIGLFGPSWSELSPLGELRGVGWAGQKRDCLSCASQRARDATKNQNLRHLLHEHAHL